MNGIESPNGMCRDERFGRRKNVGSDFDERPVAAVGSEVLEYRRKPGRIDRAFCHSAPQSAPQLNRQHGRRHAFVLLEKLQDLAAARLIDVSLHERAGVEVRPHGYARSSRSSMTVRDSGLPLTLTGRQLGVGIGPFRAAGVIKPSSTSARSVASWASSSLMGLITAIGCPRSVRTTSLPARTALMASEKRWLASRSPSRM